MKRHVIERRSPNGTGPYIKDRTVRPHPSIRPGRIAEPQALLVLTAFGVVIPIVLLVGFVVWRWIGGIL